MGVLAPPALFQSVSSPLSIRQQAFVNPSAALCQSVSSTLSIRQQPFVNLSPALGQSVSSSLSTCEPFVSLTSSVSSFYLQPADEQDEPERDGVDVEGAGAGGQGHQHRHELHRDGSQGEMWLVSSLARPLFYIYSQLARSLKSLGSLVRSLFTILAHWLGLSYNSSLDQPISAFLAHG